MPQASDGVDGLHIVIVDYEKFSSRCERPPETRVRSDIPALVVVLHEAVQLEIR